MATTVVANAGKAIIAGRMIGATPTQPEPKYIHWGTGAGTSNATDTGLFTPAAEARVAGTSSLITTTNANDTHQLVGTLVSATTQTITNAGAFDATVAGNLYVKGDFTGQALNAGDSLVFTFKIQFP